MASPKINSIQLSYICSLGIMTAHSMSHHVSFKLDFTSFLGLFYLSSSSPRLHIEFFFQLLKGRENIYDLSFLTVIIVSVVIKKKIVITGEHE